MRARGFVGELAVLTGFAVLLALLGPFGTFAMPFPARLLDWLVFMGGGTLCFRPVIGAARLLSRHETVPLPASVLCACLLAAFPATLLVAWCLAGMGWRQVTLGRLVLLYPQVLLIGGLATMLQFAIAIRSRGVLAHPAPVAEPTAPVMAPKAPGPTPIPVLPAAPRPHAAPFLQRLPAELGHELLCLENEDHYVRAHTGRGSTLILMRLGDAVAELEGVEGLRTHRSWWVARDAVREVVRRDRLIGLRLRNGLEAPVARAMVPVLRQAGWLEGDRGQRIAATPPSPG